MQQQAQYSKRWTADHPGCLIILVDQSGGMVSNSNIGNSPADHAAKFVNTMFKEIIEHSTQGAEVQPLLDVSVIGYGGPSHGVHNALGGMLAEQDIVSIRNIASNPQRMETQIEREYNPRAGTGDQVPVEAPIWVEPLAAGTRPMRTAFDNSYYIAYNWVMSHPDSFPPVVLNITCGGSTDGDALESTQQFSKLYTNDGYCLLFNFYFSNPLIFQLKYPYDLSHVALGGEILYFYKMSSILPEVLVNLANDIYSMNLDLGCRGFIFGGDARELTQFGKLLTLALYV